MVIWSKEALMKCSSAVLGPRFRHLRVDSGGSPLTTCLAYTYMHRPFGLE
jgi:hypothetical protein